MVAFLLWGVFIGWVLLFSLVVVVGGDAHALLHACAHDCMVKQQITRTRA